MSRGRVNVGALVQLRERLSVLCDDIEADLQRVQQHAGQMQWKDHNFQRLLHDIEDIGGMLRMVVDSIAAYFPILDGHIAVLEEYG